MFQKLVSHNNDLKRLVERGYAVAFDSAHLVIRDIPYLDQERKLQKGAIVTKLEFIDQERVKQVDHQIFFAGSHPHDVDGKSIPNLGGGTTQCHLSDACSDVVVQRSFSNKPIAGGGYSDFFDKIETYVAIISGPAMAIHECSPYTYRSTEVVTDGTVFKFRDTLTSRAEIGDLAAAFKDDIVALIGLGGTGGYLLDYLVKTPVREIRAFDLDDFHVHNAFRSPGRLTEDELGKTKSSVYQSRYENFRHGLNITPKFFDGSSSDDLRGVTFAFVCVDKGLSRSGIFDALLAAKIPFIDVGMGLNRKHGPLNGMVRTTYYSAEQGTQVREMGLAEMSDAPDGLYRTNIQIAELNALNASLAIIKFKQLRGYYHSSSTVYHMLFEIGDLKIVGAS